MRQKKNRKKKKNRKIRILTGVVLGVGLAGALFFNVFKIRNIQVAGNTRYTKDEIKEMVADDKWMKNTVLLTTFHSKVDMSDIPFMNSVEFTFVSYDTICIQVNEKKVVGYVEYEGQKVYFDKNGILLECPMLSAMGHRTGTSRTAMAVPSMKVPKISRMMATTRQNRSDT